MTTKFTQFVSGGLVRTTDIVVGLRGDINTQYYTYGIADSAGNPIVEYLQGAGINVNYVTIENAESSFSPVIKSAGSDINIPLFLSGQGVTGYVNIVSTGCMVVPYGTTGQRPSGAIGEFRYNSTTDAPEYWSIVNLAWEPLNPTSSSVTSVTGTTGEIDVTPNVGNVVVSIDPGYVGQTSITTLGTIGTGVWGSTKIGLGYGGTNASLIASNGGIVYSTAGAMAILAGTATAGQVLVSGASAAPSWSTTTFPTSAVANEIFYGSSTNIIGQIATANNGTLITSGSGVPSISSTLPLNVQGNISTVGTVSAGAWQSVTPVGVAYGGTGNTSFTAYSVICGGTGITTPFQNVSGVGTTGYVLTSNGAGALPTWQSTGAVTGVASVTGTTNEITASPTTGAVVLTLPSTVIAPGTLAAVTSVSAPIHLVTGSSSGTISILPQANAGTYNFNLPITAGTSGYFLTSAGGAGAPMTWTQLSSVGVTSIAGTANEITASASTGAVTLSIPSTFIAPGSIAATSTVSGTTFNSSTLTVSEAVFTDGSSNLVSRALTGTGNVVLASSPTIVTPTIAEILDANGNEMLGFGTTASAVNYINIANNAMGSGPTISAKGSDTNIALGLSAKGTGGIFIDGNSSVAAKIAFQGNTSNNSNYIILKAPENVAGDLTFVLPNAAAGANNDFLVSDTSGNLSFLTNPLAANYGGTGVANGSSSTITLGGAFAMSGAYTFTGTLTGNTSVTFPTSGTLSTSTGTVTSIATSVGITGGTITSTGTIGADFTVLTRQVLLTQDTNLTATYSNGSSGVGATLTNSGTQAALTIDSVATAVGNRILVKNQSTAYQNGIYTVTNIGSGSTNWVLTRATDYDGSSTSSIVQGDATWVQQGTNHGGSIWYLSSAGPYTIGTTSLTYSGYGGQGTIATLGTVTTGTWNATNVALAHGGTNAALTASNGGIFYSTASAAAILAGTATANQVLLSGSSTTPAWSTATYPATTTVSQLLYSSSANVVGGLATANSAVLVTTSAGVPVMSSTMTNGQLIIGSTSGTPTAATLTQGTNITITNGAGSITIAAAGTTGTLVNVQEFTSGTAATYTKSAGATNIWIRAVGGGAGGGGTTCAVGNGSGAGGGGSGGYVEHFISGAASTYTYTVGAGGAGGSAGANNGTAGGATTFSGGTLSAGGGAAGAGSVYSTSPGTYGAGGAGGSSSGGNIMNSTGAAGGNGAVFVSAGAGASTGGPGGSSVFGGGGAAVYAAGQEVGGSPAASYGGGGGGGCAGNTASSSAGGAGNAGVIIIYEYK